MNQLMNIIIVVAGAMAIYYAITGKGGVYNNDYPKEIKEEANNFTRKFLWILGPVALISGLLPFFQGLEWTYWIGMILILPTIIVYVILFRMKFGKYLKKKKF